MEITKVMNNLTKIDTQSQGIFYFSYNEVIGYIYGREEFITEERFSVSTARHKSKLARDEFNPKYLQVMPQDFLDTLAATAGVSCNDF